MTYIPKETQHLIIRSVVRDEETWTAFRTHKEALVDQILPK